MKEYLRSRRLILTALGTLVAAVVLSIISLLMRITPPIYDGGGRQVGPIVMSHGHIINFTAQDYGWPIGYYHMSCWGFDHPCSTNYFWDWRLWLLNIAFWLIIAGGVWCVFLLFERRRRKTTPKRRSRK